MNTRTSTTTASRNSPLELAAGLSPIHIESAALLLICSTLAVGAFISFPLYDDGWMALVLRESGRHALSQYMGDRPLFGYLLELSASFGASNKAVFVLINAVLWLGLALESGMLFRKLFPELREYSIVPACLTLAPIVLQTQLSTTMVAIPANLATILGYGAILLLLSSNDANGPTRIRFLIIAAMLAAAGVALSEYGVAANLVGCAILAGVGITSRFRMIRRRLLLYAGMLFALTVSGYVIFAKMADFSVRPDVAPTHILNREMSKWMEVPLDLIVGVWHSLIGAYAAQLGNIKLAWDSKSTLIGVLFGLLTALLLCVGVRNGGARKRSEDDLDGLPVRLVVLLPAIVIGLLPFSIMGRGTTLLEFGSRFRIPIMPVAAAMTVCFTLYLIRPSLRWIPIALFGLMVGYASWSFTYGAIQRSRAITGIEKALKPYVEGSEGYTVAVVPFNRFETELTANLSSTWPLDQEKRLWVVGEEPARTEFGSRSTCVPDVSLDIHVRRLLRTGKLDRLLWVEVPAGKPVLIEPYCYKSN